MNAGDDLRAGEHQQVVVALEVLRVVEEALAAVVRLAQLLLLDHRAHRAIQDQDAFGEKLAEFGAAVGLHGGVLGRSTIAGQRHAPMRNGATNPAEGL